MLSGHKNIITRTVKIAIGTGSFFLIYWRLKTDFTPDKLLLLQEVFSSSAAYLLLLFCIILIPINWGIESYKWQMVTKSTEPISLGKAMKSIYAGVCVGNLAPGRATEFLAKILFFKSENRPTITLLHFANGMIQLSVTLLIGLLSLFLKLNTGKATTPSSLLIATIFSIFLLISFTIIIFNFNKVGAWFLSKFQKTIPSTALPVSLNKVLISKLLFWSLVRYLVFSLQFIFILKLFYQGPITLPLIEAVGVYFLLTTALPMISLIEAVIRAAIAILVFQGINISETALVVTAILLWILNIVLPSIAGYIIILKEKFEFNLLKRK